MGLRVAFISDIHSNLEALEAVAGEIEGLEVYCLGDLVGYGANPNEVVEWVRDRGVHCIMGNHDYAVITGDTAFFNYNAARAIVWTRAHLKPTNLEFLMGLPRSRRLELGGLSLLMVHGSPEDPLEEYVYLESHSHLFSRYLKTARADIIALGHTHVPFVWEEDLGVVFNPGSVGQPRNGIPDACFAIVEVEGRKVTVTHRYVTYNVDRAAKKILDAGLPPFLASRLYEGF